MKKVLLSISVLAVLGFSSCSNCGPQSKADLMHEGANFLFTAINVASGNSNTATLDIATSFLNVAEAVSAKCDCNTTTEVAGQQDVNWSVFPSSDGKIPNNEPALLETNQDKGSLEACQSENCNVEASGFKANSYYIITNILDFTKKVIERNENNNENKATKDMAMSNADKFEYYKEVYGNNFKSQTIFIDENFTLFDVAADGTKTFIMNLK